MLLSVIIPLAPGETAWSSLVGDLDQLPAGTEILFVSSVVSALPDTLTISKKSLKFLKSGPGRARHMNAGAAVARGEYLWFLHADSRFGADTVAALLRGIAAHSESLLYFDLAFLDDATPLMCLNAWGVQFRSRILKVPFGDQGFCLSARLFQRVGGFPENVSYGEDHVFVWRVRQQQISLAPVMAKLYTSARKYQKNGWLKTTWLHQCLWLKQAWPEWKKLREIRHK